MASLHLPPSPSPTPHHHHVSPDDLTPAELATAHSRTYLASLQSSANVARIAEVPPAALLPLCLVDSSVLRPMRMMSRGTVHAAHYAATRGVGFNLGGGFHHASHGRGGGFCVYNDLSMAVWSLRGVYGPALRVMIVDLDAHQGDGHERDFAGDANTWVLDAFTPGIFPNARSAMDTIRTCLYFRHGDDGTTFLRQLRAELRGALAAFRPQVVVYNAGTDILEGDPLSGLSISRAAVIERDEVVFRCCGYPLTPAAAAEAAAARAAAAAAALATVAGAGGGAGGGAPPAAAAPAAASVAAEAAGGGAAGDERPFVPIVMALSGGYQRVTADVIGDALLNLHAKFGVLAADWRPPATWVPPAPVAS
jgi:acetoin utilization deacetylase AcuC-like enzyme